MNSTSPSDEPGLPSLIAQVADEFQERRRRGEKPTAAEFAQRYPQFAKDIEGVIATLEWIGSYSSEESPAKLPPGPAAESLLGDYQIIREIGRGGMGVVYEARQISLGRRVALKVLPQASALDAKRLQRFINEAQAAAHLHHEHIVPVYAVDWNAPVPCYAMQYISGLTVAALIEALRRFEGLAVPETAPSGATEDYPRNAALHSYPLFGADEPGLPPCPAVRPTTGHPFLESFGAAGATSTPSYFREIARLGIQAAAALDHAHANGVIHRDIKPGNLLIDEQGKLWITDFGLAQFQEPSGLTSTGNLLGTLRYMSPEQALGRHESYDPRTDVYGLAVTLYEWLTLTPAISSPDRATILRQITEGVIRRPRRLKPAIPVDLETIVLKGLEHNPANRYASASQLADDLGRFLENKPLMARPPAWTTRLAKWGRRHRTGVAAGALMALTLVGATGVSGYSLYKEWHTRLDREEQADNQARITREKEQEAAHHRLRARQSLYEALRAVDDYIPLLEQMQKDPQKNREARDRLNSVLFTLHLTLENENDPSTRPEVIKGYRRLAEVHEILGETPQAIAAYGQAIVLLEKMLADFAADPAYRNLLTTTSPTTGKWVWSVPGSNAPAVINKVTQPGTEPGYRRLLADLYFERGAAYEKKGEPRAAQAQFVKAQQLLEALNLSGTFQHFAQADIQMHLGRVLEALGQNPDANSAYQKAIGHWQKIIEDTPGHTYARQRLNEARKDLDRLAANQNDR